MTILAPRSAIGDWNPQAHLVLSQLRVWYDEASPAGGLSWYDRRGAGPNLGAGGGSVTSGTRKGRQTAVFDGSTWLQATYSNAQPFTRFVAIKFSTWVGSEKVIFDGRTTTVRLQRQTADSMLIYAGTNLVATFSSSLNNRWVVIATVFNGANSSIWENGVLRASGNAGTANPTGITVGAANGGSMQVVGEMGEIMGVTGALGATQIVEESRYLLRKWI